MQTMFSSVLAVEMTLTTFKCCKMRRKFVSPWPHPGFISTTTFSFISKFGSCNRFYSFMISPAVGGRLCFILHFPVCHGAHLWNYKIVNTIKIKWQMICLRNIRSLLFNVLPLISRSRFTSEEWKVFFFASPLVILFILAMWESSCERQDIQLFFDRNGTFGFNWTRFDRMNWLIAATTCGFFFLKPIKELKARMEPEITTLLSLLPIIMAASNFSHWHRLPV